MGVPKWSAGLFFSPSTEMWREEASGGGPDRQHWNAVAQNARLKSTTKSTAMGTTKQKL